MARAKPIPSILFHKGRTQAYVWLCGHFVYLGKSGGPPFSEAIVSSRVSSRAAHKPAYRGFPRRVNSLKANPKTRNRCATDENFVR